MTVHKLQLPRVSGKGFSPGRSLSSAGKFCGAFCPGWKAPSEGPPGPQRGVALLIALVVAALAALLAVGAIDRLSLDTGRSRAILQSEQSFQYAQGMEHLAWRMIREALETGETGRNFDGAWSSPFEVPGGHVLGRVLDQSGRFNLNALADPEDARRVRAVSQFRRLLTSLDLNPALADELAEWMTANARATDARYASLQPPYGPPGLPLGHVSEIRWLYSMEREAAARLLPHVTALPTPEFRLNVNTASPELLASLSPALDLEQARRVYQDGPFASLDAFLDHPMIAPVELIAIHDLLTTESVWFVVQSRVVLDEAPRDYYRLIHAGGPDASYRRFSIGTP